MANTTSSTFAWHSKPQYQDSNYDIHVQLQQHSPQNNGKFTWAKHKQKEEKSEKSYMYPSTNPRKGNTTLVWKEYSYKMTE